MTPVNSWGHFCAPGVKASIRSAWLPRVGRRRTPGLRREEVAMLADVGVTWYTWLEQGGR
jgi:hypothetical protein